MTEIVPDDRIVIDASIGLAVIRREPERPTIRAAAEAWAREGIDLVVPSHFWAEVVNVLVRRYGMSEPEVIEALAIVDDLAIQTVNLDRPTLLLALVPMDRAGLSAYDALYLALALATDGRLATLDRRLADAAGQRAIFLGDGHGRRLAERPRAYGPYPQSGPAWLGSAAVGAYIAELRRRDSHTAGEGRG